MFVICFPDIWLGMSFISVQPLRLVLETNRRGSAATVASLLGQEHSVDTGCALLPLWVVELPRFHSLDYALRGDRHPVGAILAEGWGAVGSQDSSVPGDSKDWQPWQIQMIVGAWELAWVSLFAPYFFWDQSGRMEILVAFLGALWKQNQKILFGETL